MKRFKMWFLMLAALGVAAVPAVALADEPIRVGDTVEISVEGEPGEVPTPIICVIHHPVMICVPPW